MADLESALHYILRVEVGKFSLLEGQRLVALKKFMAVLAQVSRARAPKPTQLHRGSVRTKPSPSRRSSWSGWTSGSLAVPGHMGCYPAASAVPTSRTARDSEPGAWALTSCRDGWGAGTMEATVFSASPLRPPRH